MLLTWIVQGLLSPAKASGGALRSLCPHAFQENWPVPDGLTDGAPVLANIVAERLEPRLYNNVSGVWINSLLLPPSLDFVGQFASDPPRRLNVKVGTSPQ